MEPSLILRKARPEDAAALAVIHIAARAEIPLTNDLHSFAE